MLHSHQSLRLERGSAPSSASCARALREAAGDGGNHWVLPPRTRMELPAPGFGLAVPALASIWRVNGGLECSCSLSNYFLNLLKLISLNFTMFLFLFLQTSLSTNKMLIIL